MWISRHAFLGACSCPGIRSIVPVRRASPRHAHVIDALLSHLAFAPFEGFFAGASPPFLLPLLALGEGGGLALFDSSFEASSFSSSLSS